MSSDSLQSCAPTQTPDVDHDVLREKFRAERDKRLRPEGGEQYLVTEGDFAEFYEADPYTPVVPRLPIREDVEVVVLGGGFSGLLAAGRIKQAGVSDVRIIELGGDFGGAWYWNRYPGIQIDTDATAYLPLLEEVGYLPTQKYTLGDEVYEHCQRIGKHFGLYDDAIFHTLVRSLTWDADIGRWRVGTNRDDDIRARFVVLAQGPFHRPKLPGIPGIADFEGHTFHTARWDYEYTGGDVRGGLDRLADKRVAIIGTGSSGVQTIPHLAAAASHLYVFQRTPSYINERGNVAITPEWAATLQPGWQEERRRNFHTAAFEAFAPGQPDLICDGWTEIARNLQAHLDATDGWGALADPARFLQLREEIDHRYTERLRNRIASIVEDPATAETLKPYYNYLCKRPCFNDEYLPAFNRDNVTLVDVSASRGVSRITASGVVASGVEYPVDCIIFASGFEATTDLDRKMGIAPFAGRDGRSLYDHWADGYRTLHGMTSHGFPNAFFVGFLQGGITAAVTSVFEQQAGHIAYMIAAALERGATTVEPSEEAQDAWVATVRETAYDNSDFARACTPGYFNGEGEPRLRSQFGEPYGPGFYAMADVLQAWRERGDLEGLDLSGPSR